MAPTTGVAIGSLVISDDLITTTVARATDEASAYHAAHPRRPGIPIAELAGRVDLDHDIVAWIVDHADGLALSDGFVSLQTFSNDVSSEDQRAIDDALKRLNESFDVPRSSQLGLDADLLRAMIRSGDLIRIDPDLVFTAAQIDELKAGLRDLPDGFTVSEFKDHFGMARRQSVPLLEWLDKTGMTLRSGDGRTVR
jgi:selenocysteine-specific elongation factor